MNDTLTINACIYLPGNKVDLGEVAFNQNTDDLWSLVRKIDFGIMEVRKTEFCFSARTYFDELETLRIDKIEVTQPTIDDITIDGVDIDWGLGALVATRIPIIGELLTAAIVQSEQLTIFFNATDTDFEHKLINHYKNKYANKIFGEIRPTIQRALRSAINNAGLNARERLIDACNALIPTVGEADNLHYFYRYLRWNCNGFASDHRLRSFQTDTASAGNGCYGTDAFFTPADANAAVWWGRYIGQEWYWPGLPNQGCRIGATMASNLDAAIWPTLRCAVSVSNVWINNGPVPPGATLRTMMATTCTPLGLLALTNLYGDGSDLIDLYREVHGVAPRR